ncbi:metabotropic glutamate receptor 8-like isoform X2 [Leptopilina heterotoma]|nr:metabotropic glutamate receptor 8-like isoform X2 [Leptopilina heterotoma]XP_043461433.1 metabotropic glutamate receptor 8-like isoform X2 [Leptopilina heterotoma]
MLLPLLIALITSIADAKIYVNISGDIVLGALFPVHRKGFMGQNCGKIQSEDGLQPLEAMLYTIEQINQDPKILPGIRLGAIVFDSCDNSNYAMEQTLYFVKGFIAHFNEFHMTQYKCLDGSVPKFFNGGFDKVVAVLAAASSSVTLQIASILRLFSIPQISYMATSPSLSNKEKYPHFFRTVPSDVNQAHAMLEILKQFDWTYVSVVYSDTEYGIRGFETLVSLASKYSICFSAPQKIAKERFLSEDYDSVIQIISNRTEVRVVVLFAEKVTTLKVLESAKRLGVGEKYVWIGSDAWSNNNHREFLNPDNSQDQQQIVLEGALAVLPLNRKLFGFDEYFTNLTLQHEDINPWFREFWMDFHKCRKKVNVTNQIFNESIHRAKEQDCENSELKINPQKGYKQQRFLHFVRDAVYSVAYALHDLHIKECGKNFKGLCSQHIDGETLLTYLSNVSFKDEAGNTFRFMNSVDGPPRYSILNYQKDLNGTHRWLIVGNYTQTDTGKPILHLERKIMKYRNQERGGRKYFPNSTCAQPCLPNQVKFRVKQDICCWRCRNCGLYQFKLDDHRCEDCELGTRPTSDKMFCEEIPVDFVNYSNPWAIATMAVASCGILLNIFIFLIFWIYRETPIIKASGRELSSLLLVGTLISFLMTFVIVAKPSVENCALTRFGIGICYSLCYGALVTKTNRIHRIFNRTTNNPHHKPRYTSPKSQLIITGIFTLVEVIINSVWLIKLPPTVTDVFPSREIRLRICQGLDDSSYMVGLIYPFILIVLCTIYAIKTRKCPEGFNETRLIAFTNYTTMILWLAFVPLYLASTSNALRIITLALSISLSGLVQLGFFFFPKVYTVLRKPEKNTKELVMSQHRSSPYLQTASAPIVISSERMKITFKDSESSSAEPS